MRKAVLISIQPKWCDLIANGEKAVEVRKTRPKLETPFKCYIYRTKGTVKHLINDKWVNMPVGGTVIGEFVCDRIDQIGKRGIDNNFDYCYLSLNVFGNDDIEIEITDIKKSCVRRPELNAYGKSSDCLFAWHISDLQIYDKPKELSEFVPVCRYGEDGECAGFKKVWCPFQERDYNPDGSVNIVSCTKRVNRPPQSWCYVEELTGGDG